MPTTVTHDVELIDAGKGPGGSSSGGNGNGQPGGGGGSGSSGPTAVPQRAYVTGMTVALGGILMFFMSLVSAFIVRKGAGTDWYAMAMPRVLWLNTLILLASSFTLAHARKRFLAHDEAGFRHWWGVTTILGVFFLAGQIIAWRQLAAAGVFLATNPNSSFFYVFTAAHGLHVAGGILGLLLVAFRPTRRLTLGTATEIAAMYWHFMDGLWIFLFLVLLLGR
jgi:cytochrome c oxidase subunit III